jgi:DNA-binding MarR family transcriptional regulator
VSRPPHLFELDYGIADVALAALPSRLIGGSRQNRNGRAEKLPPVIKAGAWHDTMVSAAGTLRARGFTEQAAVAALLEQNATDVGVAGDDGSDIRAIVDDVYERYPADREIELRREPDAAPRALDEVVAAFQRRLYMPDPASLLLTLATVVANMMEEGDPVWTVNVGGSSRGKTEVIAALDGFPGVRVVGGLTVAALLSGTARKDRAKAATGGIFNELGDRGVLVVKDFGALLTLHRDARAQVLQALRDIYDGLYTRDVGVDGGTKLRWEGRLGLIAGATSALDSAHSVLSALGERWVTIRLPDGGEREMVGVALADTDTRTARSELRDAVHGFLATLEAVPLRPVTASELELFEALGPLVMLARSPVERDSYKRDIVHVHSPEGPARIVRQLHKLLVSLEAMGVQEPAGLILRAGLDSIPSPRRDVLVRLLQHGEQSTANIATALGLATTNASRALEDLAAHKLLTRRKARDNDNSANLWNPSERIAGFWQTLNSDRGETA